MSFVLHPWQFFFVVLVGWVEREQQKIILFYQAELETMMKAQGRKRLRLTDDQRRLLAVKGKSLGRKALTELTTIVTFVKAHWDVLASIDFTTVEVWTKGGLVTYYVLFVMEVATRRVQFAGCTPNPNEPWMKQIARNLTDCEDGFLNGKRFLIMDRDAKFTEGLCDILEGEGVEVVKLPPRSPDVNPHIERFIKSVKDESLSRLILFGENMLRNAVREFLAHYHTERNHQSLGNKIIQPGDEAGRHQGDVQCRERLGGMLRYYYRDAA